VNTHNMHDATHGQYARYYGKACQRADRVTRVGWLSGPAGSAPRRVVRGRLYINDAMILIFTTKPSRTLVSNVTATLLKPMHITHMCNNNNKRTSARVLTTPQQSAQVAYLSSVFKYECELKLFFLYELSVRDLPVWTVCLVSTKSREDLEYDKVRGW